MVIQVLIVGTRTLYYVIGPDLKHPPESRCFPLSVVAPIRRATFQISKEIILKEQLNFFFFFLKMLNGIFCFFISSFTFVQFEGFIILLNLY